MFLEPTQMKEFAGSLSYWDWNQDPERILTLRRKSLISWVEKFLTHLKILHLDFWISLALVPVEDPNFGEEAGITAAGTDSFQKNLDRKPLGLWRRFQLQRYTL